MNDEFAITEQTNDLLTSDVAKPNQSPDTEIMQDDTFSYAGYQVVRGEFFAHLSEPSITFNDCHVSVNTACIRKLPTADFVQILVNPGEKKLAVRPCDEDEKDSFRWCYMSSGKRKPKDITCRVFFAKIVELMDWSPAFRYKLLGKLIRSGSELLFSFDLTTPEIFQRGVSQGDNQKIRRTPLFPAEWQNQFGLPVDEHRKSLQVNIFNGYVVFGIKDASKTPDQNHMIAPESD